MVKSGIKIYVRLKPTKKPTGDYEIGEQEDRGASISIGVPKSEQSGYVNNRKETYSFQFNHVFDQSSRQDDVFETVAREVIDNCLEGYNGTIFAYGQTGSGKTFTITGGVEKFADRGIIPRTLTYLFHQYAESPGKIYTTHISYLEIYNQSGYDLLDPKNGPAALEDLPKVILLEDEDGNVHLKNLSLHPASNEEEALNWLFLGDTNRMMAETPMNMASTRSHCIFTVHISSRESGSSTIRKAKLHLVDLAGSERVGKTGVGGTLLVEAKFINLSLHFLEQVIVALSEKSRSHIPYRNSMMTSVLRDSLGGNCMTTMIATCAVEKKNIDETISTCRFAQRVALVKNDAILNEELDPKLMVQRLKQKVQELKEELVMATGEERTDELTTEERHMCQEMVDAYIQDASVEAMLQLGGDMRKIKLCFSMMKDIIKKKIQELIMPTQSTESVSDEAPTGEKDATSATSADEEKRSDIVQDRDVSLELELEMLKDRLHQRDKEIVIVLRMLKQERKRADIAEMALAEEGATLRPVSPASPDHLSPIRLARNGMSSTSSFSASSTTAAAVCDEKAVPREVEVVGNGTGGRRVAFKGDTGSFLAGQGPPISGPAPNISHDSEEWRAVLNEELARARQEAFDTFKKDHADARAMEYLRKVLIAKYKEAKDFGEQVNKIRLHINKLKSRLEKYRIARRLHEGTSLASDSENEREEELKKEMKAERASFKEQCDVLSLMKTEAEHMQHLLHKTKVKIQKDFEEWWITTHSSRVRREHLGTPVGGDLRKAAETSLGDTGMSCLGARGLSPRTAWRTPPVPSFSKEAEVRSPQQQQASKDCKSHLRCHGEAITSQFSLQQKQQLHQSGALGSREELSPPWRSGDRRSREPDSYAAARAVKDGGTQLSPTSLSSTWQCRCAGLPSPTDTEDQQEYGGGGKREVEGAVVYGMPMQTSSNRDGHGRCSKEKYSMDSKSSLPLTGDPNADKDIIAFYKARQKLINRAEKKH